MKLQRMTKCQAGPVIPCFLPDSFVMYRNIPPPKTRKNRLAHFFYQVLQIHFHFKEKYDYV